MSNGVGSMTTGGVIGSLGSSFEHDAPVNTNTITRMYAINPFNTLRNPIILLLYLIVIRSCILRCPFLLFYFQHDYRERRNLHLERAIFNLCPLKIGWLYLIRLIKRIKVLQLRRG